MGWDDPAVDAVEDEVGDRSHTIGRDHRAAACECLIHHHAPRLAVRRDDDPIREREQLDQARGLDEADGDDTRCRTDLVLQCSLPGDDERQRVIAEPGLRRDQIEDSLVLDEPARVEGVPVGSPSSWRSSVARARASSAAAL